MRFIAACLAAGFLIAASPASAQNAKLVKSFGSWHVFVHGDKGNKICFAASQPKSIKPENVNRGPIFFYLTTWQKDGVRNEVSIKLGYPVKPAGKPNIAIGSQKYELFPKGDKVFLKDPDEERKLIAAMKKGASLTVTSISTRGTTTIDDYDLSGISAALKELGNVCQ
ncbi:MAG: hypothetical protein P8Y67_03135 [Alphaproteobacteria bacterium]|jgi:hypothetical protein